MLEIEIKKSRGGRNANDQFTNQYLADGGGIFQDASVETFARDLVAAEQIIMPDNVEFLRVVIRTVDINGDAVPFQSRSFPVDSVGLFTMPAGEVVCPPHIVAAVEKQSISGRPGISFYRHCVTTDEFDDYQTNRTIPVRFPAFLVYMEAMGASMGLRLAMPDRPGDNAEGPRFISSFLFGGFRMNDPNRRKDSAKKNTLEAAQQQINEWARAARYSKGAGWDVTVPDPRVGVANALRLQALALWNSLEVEVRARIKWPAIFSEPRVIAGV